MRRSLLAAVACGLVSAALPVAPASAAPSVLSTGYGVRDARGARSATGVCVATGVEVVSVAFTECGFAGEDSPHTATSAGLVAVATFTGPIGEQPKSLCWEGYAVTVSGALLPFAGCSVVS